MYISSIFILCLLYLCQTVLTANDGVHTLVLKSYRESSMVPNNKKLVSGTLKLLTGNDDKQNDENADTDPDANTSADADADIDADTNADTDTGGDENDDDAAGDGKAKPLPSHNYGPGTAILESDNNVLWYTTITIGTGKGKQEFTVDVDTGSSDLFIPGIECGANCDEHTRYDPKASPTSKETNEDFALNFADRSSVKGKVYRDTISIGGLMVTNQSFGVGQVYSKGLSKEIFSPDGLFGLGFRTLAHIKEPSLLDTLYDQKKIKQRIFGVRLDLAEVDGDQGELTLGGYNKDHVVGELAYTPVVDKQYWQVKFDQVTIGRRVVASERSFIVDTGSTLINADRSFVRQVYSKIPGAKRVAKSKHWTLPCKNIPTLVFTIGGSKFNIDPSNFSPGLVSEGSDICYGGVVENVGPNEPWIVGGIFLANVYTVFDVDQKRIGFGALKEPKTKNQ